MTKEAANSYVQFFFDEFPSTGPGVTLAGYIPIRGEFDILPLLDELHARHLPIALPVIQPGPALVFREWSPGLPLAQRRFGLLEPGDDRPQVWPGVVFVPLLGFDRRGNRLGYGAGYYDAGLKSLRAIQRVVAIGAAYSEQEFDDIPAEPHDERLDYILTPSGLFRCGD